MTREEQQAILTISLMAAFADAKETTVIAELFARSGAVGVFQEIREAAGKLDEISLGDADLDISLSDRLTDTQWDWDGTTEHEKQVTLLEGKGPLLTFENNASGLSWAVELRALDEGRLVIHSFYDGKALQRIDLDKNGRARKPCDKSPASSIAFSMLWARDEVRALLAPASD